ncbi:MAG TPA: L-threonylcarbamoyladenylate synthase [Candidatus Dormibacteraeota bacterium]|nr:L-threonylcarbamoyladenylate synthase [Candidatus Dormibacteraeota bacterium]
MDAAGADLAAALAAVRRGEVIAVATDTVHGLACDPRNAAAVDRVYALKRRPADLELTLLAHDVGQLERLVAWTPAAARLAAAFWPGPLSLVLPVGDMRVAVPRRGETLSVRVPAHPLLLALLEQSGPLASTSANRHGEPPALSAAAVRRQFGDQVSQMLGGGSPAGQASTIIDCSVTPPRVLREGPIDHRSLSEFVQG